MPGGNPNWVKGVSGNPGGQRRIIKEVRELAQDESPESIRALARVRDTSTDGHAVVAACKAIIETGCGKPPQAMTVDVNHHEVARLSTADLDARIAELEA